MDAASYTRVRWNDLVRTLVSLGVDPAAAEEAAADALVRCYPQWRQASRDGDVDVLVYAELLDGLADVDDAPRVLTAGAGLTAYQAEQVLGEPVDEPGAQIGDEWDDLYRGTAPVADIETRVAARRRRRTLTTVGGLLAVAVVVVVSFVVTGADPAPPAPPPQTLTAHNPIGIAWFSQDAVQLGSNTVPVAGLRALTQAGPAATYTVVYGLGDGTVVQVDPDATSHPVGHFEPHGAIVGAPNGHVAWVDPRGARPRLVLWDTATRAPVDTLALDDRRATPVAVDGDAVYVRTRTGDLRWVPGTGPAARVAGGLLDVAGGVQLRTGVGPAAGVVARPDGSFAVHGVSATLSDAGDVVASWTSGVPGVTLTRWASPAPTTLDLPVEDRVLDARFGPDGDLVVLAVKTYRLSIGSPRLGTASGRSPLTDLFTCRPAVGSCVLAGGRESYAGSDPSPITLAR